MRSRKRAVSAGLVALLLLCLAVSARAQNTTCASEIRDATITGNLTVPEGAVCVLNGVTVNGNVFVDPGGCLSILEFSPSSNSFPIPSIIDGNVSATKARCVNIFDSSVAGNVTLIGTAGLLGGVDSICRSVINGSLNIENTGSNPTWHIGCGENMGNVIHGSLTFDNNLGGGTLGGNTFTGNTIEGNLVCENNKSAPTDGSVPNSVRGRALGQCSALVAP